MFDLADECGKDLKELGYQCKTLEKYSTSEAFLIIESEEKSRRAGLDKGEYYIINSPFVYDYGIECFSFVSSLIAKKLKKIFKNYGINKRKRCLIVGLGNPDISSDMLGKEVFDNIEISPLSKENKIFKFCPNIFFATGIDTSRMINMFIKELSINYCIIIDSLTTSNISRLGTSFQITTSGMTPGSGVNRFGKKIDEKSTGVPCFSIGVPFMIYSGVVNKDVESEIMLCPKDTRQEIEGAGFIIAKALNEVLK